MEVPEGQEIHAIQRPTMVVLVVAVAASSADQGVVVAIQVAERQVSGAVTQLTEVEAVLTISGQAHPIHPEFRLATDR